jgi:hypothetical protein
MKSYKQRTHKEHTLLRKQLRDHIIANPGSTHEQLTQALGQIVREYLLDLQRKRLVRWTKPQHESHSRARWYPVAMDLPAHQAQPVEQALAFADRRQALSLQVPPCPFCKESKQVQLTFWLRPPAAWKCRSCKRSWTEEPCCNACEGTTTVKVGEEFKPCPSC